MHRLATLLLQFNKPLWICHTLFSVFGLYFIMKNGIGLLVVSFSLKLAGYLGATLYQNYFTPQIYFYYRNTGNPVRKLYLYSFAADFLIYLAVIAVYQFYFIPPHVKG
jgi:hypothetical protein